VTAPQDKSRDELARKGRMLRDAEAQLQEMAARPRGNAMPNPLFPPYPPATHMVAEGAGTIPVRGLASVQVNQSGTEIASIHIGREMDRKFSLR